MIQFNNKKGSSTVFLAIILPALAAVCLTLIFTSREGTVISRTDAIARLASESILSEFDYDVQKDYGIFMMKGSDDELSNKLRNYVLYSTDSMKDVEVTSANASGGQFSVMNLDSVREQIIAYAKMTLDKTILQEAAGTGSGGPSQNSSGSSSGHDVSASGESGNSSRDGIAPDSSAVRPARVLCHGPTITSLPSKLLLDKSLYEAAKEFGENLSNITAIFNTGSRKLLFDSYVLQEFDNCLSVRGEGNESDPLFFRSEVEYILSGKLSDRDNEKKTDNALKALRFGPNLAFLYADPDKQKALAAAAELLTPGPAAVATQLALSSAWALAEAVNDVKLLHEGRRVPMFKTGETWATDLDNVIEEIDTGVIHPDVESGFDYRQYLRVLLFVKDETIKTARVLDLIQINMRQNCKGDFLVQEYFTGLSTELTVNDRGLHYAWEY